MLCSVVVPARNAAKTIGACIIAVLSQSMPRENYEVIVVDDGSTDHTAYIARKFGIRVLPQPPLGVGAARNTGARAAAGDLVVFLDADCLPKLDWLAQMVAPFSDPRVVAVQGAYSSDEPGLVPRLIQAECDDEYRRLESYPSIDVIQGFSAAYRRSIFLAAGGFDTTFAVAGDVELAYRLAKTGMRLVFAPKACVYHNHGSSVRGYLERTVRVGLWRSLVRARHPEKAGGDSQSSEALKAQVPLASLTVATVVLGTRWRPLLPLAGLLAALFAGSTVPYAWRSRRAGTDVALAAPAAQFLRAFGLACGMALGGGTLMGTRLARSLNRIARSLGR
jgi:GT2 family glycosyltransferase